MAAGIFINLGSGIKGESEQEGHIDTISASSIQWGVGRAVGTYTSGNRETSSPSFSELVFTKTFDISSNDIAVAASMGKSLAEVTITLRKDTGEGGIDYLVYTLTDCIISGYSVSSGGTTPMESVSLNYVKIKSVYKKLATDHSDAGENEFEYDLRAQS